MQPTRAARLVVPQPRRTAPKRATALRGAGARGGGAARRRATPSREAVDGDEAGSRAGGRASGAIPKGTAPPTQLAGGLDAGTLAHAAPDPDADRPPAVRSRRGLHPSPGRPYPSHLQRPTRAAGEPGPGSGPGHPHDPSPRAADRAGPGRAGTTWRLPCDEGIATVERSRRPAPIGSSGGRVLSTSGSGPSATEATGERSMSQSGNARIMTRARYDAVLFDLDGVLTDTASLPAACWKRTFDEYLRKRAARSGGEFRPFDIARDYRLHVDGKPRPDGVRDFLGSRGIRLPEGTPDDPPEAETVGGLGNRKNALVSAAIEDTGAEPYEGSVRLLHQLRRGGFKVAVVTSSRNCDAVLRAAGLEAL